MSYSLSFGDSDTGHNSHEIRTKRRGKKGEKKTRALEGRSNSESLSSHLTPIWDCVCVCVCVCGCSGSSLHHKDSIVGGLSSSPIAFKGLVTPRNVGHEFPNQGLNPRPLGSKVGS